MAIIVELFDGTRLEFPEGTPTDVIDRVARQQTREIRGLKPESGGVAAFKAGIQSLIGSGAALAGRTGLMDVEAAQREYEERKQRAAEIFQPGAEGWSAPLTKISELAGGSLPYMAAPLAAGAAAAFAPVSGVAATALGLGAAGLASAGQFTGTNLARQLEEGKQLRDTDLAAAAAAAVPQALLDTIALRMMPGVGRIFGQAGVKVTKENAEAIAKQALSTTLKDYAVTTGGAMTREGVTEAAQQALERLQAGLNITDPQARAEYFESFVGGAVLGGVVSPAGRFMERGSEQRQARRIIEDEANRVAQEQRAAEEAQKQTPEYLFDLEARYKEASAQKTALETAAKNPGKKAKPKEKEAYAEAKKQLDEFKRTSGFNALEAEYKTRKQEIDVLAQQRNQAAELAAAQTVPQEAQTLPFYESPQGTLPGMEAVEQPAAPTVEEPVDYKTIVAKLNAYLDDLRTRAQTTVDLDEKLKLGEAYAQAQKALKEAEEKAKQTPGADNRERLLRKKMAVAEEEGDVAAQAALAKQLKELGVTDLRTAQPELPGMQTDFFEPGAVQKRKDAYYSGIAQEIANARPDLVPPVKESDPLARWIAGVEAEAQMREEEAIAPQPVSKEEGVVNKAAAQQSRVRNAMRDAYVKAMDAYQQAKGTADAPIALRRLLNTKAAYERLAGGRPIGSETPVDTGLSQEAEQQLERALTEIAGAEPATTQDLEARVQKLADIRKAALAKVSENASELTQYEKLGQYLGTPKGLTDIAKTPEMAEALERRTTPMLAQAQASRNEAIAAAIQEIKLQRDLAGLAPLTKADEELQIEFRKKLTKDLEKVKQDKTRVDNEQRQKAIAEQLQRVNARIAQIEGGDRPGRFLGYASAFRQAPEKTGELSRLYTAYRNLITQQGLTPQAAQLNRSLQNLVDFYTVGSGAAKPKFATIGEPKATRELILGKRAFTGYEPTVEGKEVRYNKPRKIEAYSASEEEQALVQELRERELAQLNEAAEQRYTEATDARAKKQILDELQRRIAEFEKPATKEEVERARAEKPATDEYTGDLFEAATQQAKAEFQTAVEARDAARSEYGRALAGMRGKSTIKDQAKKLAEKFGKDLDIGVDTYEAARTRLTTAQKQKLAAEAAVQEKGQAALRALADDAEMAKQEAEAVSRAAKNTITSIAERFKKEEDAPADEVRQPPIAMRLMRRIVELQSLIADKDAKQNLLKQVDELTKYSPTQFITSKSRLEIAEKEDGRVSAALKQAIKAAAEGEAWASNIEKVQAHIATLETYLEGQEAALGYPAQAKEQLEKLVKHEQALRSAKYSKQLLTPAEIRNYTKRRLELAQAEYDSIKNELDALHRQLVDTEVAFAKRQLNRVNGLLTQLFKRTEEGYGADLGNQELNAFAAQHDDAVKTLEQAIKTFEERKKAESVSFSRKSPVSALQKYMQGAQERFETSVQKFKDKQKALELQFRTPATRSGDTPVVTAATRRAETAKERATKEGVPLEQQLEGALAAQRVLKKKGSKKQRAAIAEKIADLRKQISGESAYGQQYYTPAGQAEAEARAEMRDEEEAREAGKEETTKAGRKKAAKEIFGVQRTIAETGEVPQVDKDKNILEAVLLSNRQAFEMAVEQGFKATAIRPQKRGKSATPERLVRTPLEGIAYRLRQEIIERLEAPQTKAKKKELNELRNRLYGLEEAINTPPVTVEERRKTARAILAKLPKDMRNTVVDKFKGRLPSGGISVTFFDRFADALENAEIRKRLGTPLSQTGVVVTDKEQLADIGAETKKRIEEIEANESKAKRDSYYAQKEKELQLSRKVKNEGVITLSEIDALTKAHPKISNARIWNDAVAFKAKVEDAKDTVVIYDAVIAKPGLKLADTYPKFLARVANIADVRGATLEITGKAKENIFKTKGVVEEYKKFGWAPLKDGSKLIRRPQPIEKLASEFADRMMQQFAEAEAKKQITPDEDFEKAISKFKRKGKDATANVVEGKEETAIEGRQRFVGKQFIDFSRGPTADPSSVASLRTELGKVFPDLGRVQMYESVEALIAANPQYEGRIPSDARGFVDSAGNKAFLIAENIDKGRALSVLLHEVGAHVGLKNMLGNAQYNALVNAVKTWEKRNDGSIEAKVAQAARRKVEAAETEAGHVNDELLAYAIEEAVNAGVKPMETKGVLGQWLSQITTLFRKALEKFGMAPEKLDAQGLVDLAFGAAQIEMAPKVPQMSRRNFLRGAGAALGALKLPPLSKEMNLDLLRNAFEASLNAREALFNTIKTVAKTKGLTEVVDQYEDLYEGDNPLVAFTQSEALSDFLYNFTYDENYQGDGYDYYLNELLSGKDGLKIVADLQQALRAQHASLIDAVQKIGKEKGLPEVGELFFSLEPKLSIVEKNGAYNIPLTRIINAGDETSSPWLLADGRVVGTGQDHLSVIDVGSFSEHMQNTGDIRAMFARSPDGKEYTIALHMAEGQKPTKAQIQTVLSIFKARENKNTKLIIGETNKAVNPEYNEFSLDDFKNKYVGSAADDLQFSRAVAQKFPVTSRVIDATVASQRTWKDDVKDNLLNFRTQYLDKLFPAEQALKLGGVAQKVATQAMYYLRMYDYRMHMTSQAAFVGAPDLVEKTRKDGSKEWVIEANKGANIADAVKVISTKEVANAAGGADNAGRMLTMYMAAIRGERVGYEKLNFGRAAAEAEIKRIEGQLQSPSLSQEARSNLQKKRKQLSDRLNTLPTEADFKAIRAEVDANETLRKAFNEAREIYNQYNRNLLNFVVKTGAISRAKADEWIAQGDYVPYYRVRDGVAELLIGGETPIRIGNLKDSPHLEKLVGGDEPIMNFLDSSVQNTAMLLEMGMHNLAMRNLMWELQHVGLAKISKETKRTSAPEGAVTFKMDGNDHFAIVDTDAIGVDSELLVKGLAGIPTMLPTVTKLMGIPARILRKMVLASPVYWGRQLVRDSTAAALASGADMLPVIGALKQIGKENILEARGITGGQVFTGMPEDMANILRGMQRGKISLSGGLAWLEAQSAKADALTRKAQYDSYIEQGMSEMEATLMAMESMNFARRGLSPSLHMLSTVIPFFNAQLQGLDVLYRSFFGKMPMNEQLDIRRKLLARGMLLFGMSMMYAFLMQDDEAYKNAKPEEKYGNWFVPLPGTDQKLRVPIPFELGYIFKALPEALVNSMMSEEGAEDAVKAFTHILQQTIPGGSSYMLPQAIKPGLEVLMGTSMYTGRGIESGREQQMEAGYRVRESTTEAAAWLGEATGFSPIKMEYLIRGYTAGVGIAFLQALSLPMARSGPERAERRPSDLPVVGTLFQPSDASGIIDATYERMQELAQKEDTYKRLLKEGRTEAAAEYLEKNAGVVGYESLAGRFRQQMGKITDYERKIRASDMTPQEKRQRLDEMRDAKIRLAAAYRDALKGAKDQGYRSGMGGSYGGAGASASF